MSDELARIQSIIDAIRLQEVKPGTRIRTATTLVTCPADMDQIDRHLSEYATIIRAQVIEELAQRAEDEDQCLVSWHQVPGTRIPQEGDDLADWLRAQDGTATHE